MKTQSLFFVLVIFVLFGCGEEDPLEVFEVSDKAPVVSIEKVGEKEGDYYVEIEYQIVSDSKVNTDLLVRVASVKSHCERNGKTTFFPRWHDRSIWVTIPKGETKSQTTTIDTASYESLYIEMQPLLTVDLVGEGEVIDQEELQRKFGGLRTAEGQTIPEDFVFPYYEVADSESTLFFAPKPAKVISADPPNGSLLSGFVRQVTITFDGPAQCPRLVNIVSGFPPSIRSLHGNRSAYVYIYRNSKFAILTGSEELGNEVVSEEFHYGVIR